MILETYDDLGKVCLDEICAKNPRLALAKRIADEQHFLHWELEFADLFAERGGFDLIVGNPPWIKVEWNEQAVLSEKNPIFTVKNLTATQTTRERAAALDDSGVEKLYFAEYETMSGMQAYLNAIQNYASLKGQQTNLYKCFLPQSWASCNSAGVFAFLHPDGIFDDPNGGVLREQLYSKLKRHFQFENELNLFEGTNDHGRMRFSLNVYKNGAREISFDIINNVFLPSTIDQCYEGYMTGDVPGIKDDNNNWNVQGHPERVVHISNDELVVFARLFDGNEMWKQARLPGIHAKQLLSVLELFSTHANTINTLNEDVFASQMWNETAAQQNGTTIRNVTFPLNKEEVIYSGPHIGMANPHNKTSRRICVHNSDYDSVDLAVIDENYFQRFNYSPLVEMNTYLARIQTTPWGTKYNTEYRLATRAMLNLSGERTLFACILPSGAAHIHTVYSIAFSNNDDLLSCAAIFASVPIDYIVKVTGKGFANLDVLGKFPIIKHDMLASRILLLNCLTKHYAKLWESSFSESFARDSWLKEDARLSTSKFCSLNKKWAWDFPLRSDYERRQALVEIDVITASIAGMSLEQLKTVYRIQFPVLQQYEADTWYDRNGRIVFTNNRSLTGVGYSRAEWNEIKDAQSGTFTRTITDDTRPGGAVERTIEYVAPFDRCDREQDYETAWKFFSEKYKLEE
jgi:hypothetical protein